VKAWIGLGGNRENSRALLSSALSRLENHPEISVCRVSRFYRSAPWGVTDQPDFVNAVAEIETALTPGDLLQELLDIEARLGRVREGRRWGSRCIDLDLLTYEEVILTSVSLVLPHPRMQLRAFVLLPILELEPEFTIPGIGKARLELQKLDRQEVESVKPLQESPRESKT